ncbi:MAG TPA: AmmeMemoRadiSam system protein B [Terriglobia bacterium]|nr:AmmeMemoRadiSam system protein B [Terriglobia bacterium]
MLPTNIRHPAVAGQFYPSQPDLLQLDLDRCLAPEAAEQSEFSRAIGCVVPHAGYMYSGHVAGAVYRRLPARTSYIILGPNHFGRGAPLAEMETGSWLTPLGEVPLNPALGEAVRRACPALVEDAKAHAREHSLEVQLPFLQRCSPAFTLLPIAIGVSDYGTLEALGHAVSEAVKGSDSPILIVASSDFNHYEPDSVTRVKDRKAIDRILDLDPEGLYETVFRERISMCGLGPTVAMLVAANDLGAKGAELIKYATSADAGGPVDSVVGYGGIVITAD